MSFVRELTMLAAVPLLVLGQKVNDDAPPDADAPGDGFAPYQTILDRMPFGPEPAGFNPDTPLANSAAAQAAAAEAEAELTEDEQQIVSSVRVSILNVTPSGAIAVGFTDSAAQPAVNYFMKVGEKRDVWEVKSADPTNQVVVLVKNGVEATLEVGKGAPDGKGAKGGGARPMPGRPNGPRMAAAQAEGGGGAVGQQSAMERLRARRQRSIEDLKAEEARREAVAAEARKDAARAAVEREQQREALIQIQEELRRQREEREQRAAQEAAAQQPVDGAAPE